MLAGVAVLSGCGRFSGSNCNKPQMYAQAQSVPALKVPAGLDAPDTRAALRIPELNEPEAPRGAGDPCLEMPPPYSAPAAPAAARPAPAPAAPAPPAQ
jgi:2-oxoglutarate decarboxylase